MSWRMELYTEKPLHCGHRGGMSPSAWVRGRNYLMVMAAEISIAIQPRMAALLTRVMDGWMQRVEEIGTYVGVYLLENKLV